MTPKRAIATHIADLDGIGSASVLKRAFPDAKIYLLDYNEAEEKLRKILEYGPQELYIADLNLGEGNRGAMELLENEFKDVDIYWYDHHQWLEEMKERVQKIAKELAVDDRKCGTELVQERFLPQDETAKTIAFYARVTDFGGRSEEAQKISDVISARYGEEDFLVALCERLSQGGLWSEELEEIREEYHERKIEKTAEALDRAKIYKGVYNGEDYTLGVTLADKCLKGGYIGSVLSEKLDADIAVIFYENGSMSLRMKNKHEGKIDLSEWARLFGGGGHKNAGGAQYGEAITEANLFEVAEAVLRKLPLKGLRKAEKGRVD